MSKKSEEQLIASVSADSKSSKEKADAVDELDELFCDPSTLARTRPAATVDVKISNDGAKVLKSRKSDASSGPAGISGTKSNKATADSSPGIGGTQPVSVDSGDLLDEDTVKGKVKTLRDGIPSIAKVGSTNKPRKLPDWLAGITTGEGSKGTTSRKRKTLSKTDSKVSTTEKSDSRDKDSDTLLSPPPPKKVQVDRLPYLHFEQLLHSNSCKLC